METIDSAETACINLNILECKLIANIKSLLSTIVLI